MMALPIRYMIVRVDAVTRFQKNQLTADGVVGPIWNAIGFAGSTGGYYRTLFNNRWILKKEMAVYETSR